MPTPSPLFREVLRGASFSAALRSHRARHPAPISATNISATNAPGLAADAEAQDLDAKVKKTGSFLERLGVVGFWIPANRDFVMQLPSGSGAMVLEAFEREATNTAALPEAEREASSQLVLRELETSR